MAELPSGTVTFLLTDVEGSTALWEEAPEATRVALARHDVLLATGIQEGGGHVIRSKGEGDSALAVFGRAGDALARRPRIAAALGVAASKVVMWGGGHLAQHMLRPIYSLVSNCAGVAG